MQRKTRYLGIQEALLAITALLCISLSHASTVLVDSESEFLHIADAVDYYEDSSESLTIDDVVAPNFGVNFIAHDEDILNFGHGCWPFGWCLRKTIERLLERRQR